MTDLTIPEIQRALRVKRFTEPLTVRPFISNLINQLWNREHGDDPARLRQEIEATIRRIEAARQGES